MKFLLRIIEHLVIAAVVFATSWLVIVQIFVRLDQRFPAFLAIVITYFISAYLVVPRVVQLTSIVLRKGHIPRCVRSPDGLSADPVNMILIGSEEQLIATFEKMGWHQAERLNLRTSWRIIVACAMNRSYPTAPFSPRYLFGRRQEYGFQEPIGKSPWRRHHVRFWGANVDPSADYDSVHFWLKKQAVDMSRPVMWVGAATEDIGIGFTSLTYQLTHRVDPQVDEERDYILAALHKAGLVEREQYVESDKLIVGKYVSDGRIVVVGLADMLQLN